MPKRNSPNKIKWKPYIITVIVTLLTGLIVGLAVPAINEGIRTPDLKLQYYVQDTLPFKTQTTEIASYQVTIKNEGAKIIEQVTIKNEGAKIIENILCAISIPQATINQSDFLSDYPLNYTQDSANSALTVKIENLNPQESGTIYILATSNNELPKQPEIQIRALGVSGVKAALIDNQDSISVPMQITLIVMSLIAAGSTTLSFFRRKEARSIIKTISKDNNPNDCFGYLCGIHGLMSEIDRVIQKSITKLKRTV